MAIIDIHTHINYDIDDGSLDREMSLKLIEMDYTQGVHGIFCTNHSYGMVYGYKHYHRRFEKLSRLVADRYPGLSLYKGCEIICNREKMHQNIRNIQNDIFPVMNGTNYILLEFNPHRTRGVEEMQFCLEYALDKGYIPIIAHVERYEAIYDDPLANLMKLKELGCLIQINLYSVEQDQGSLGQSRKELANLFLKNRLVDFVGTDSHRLDYKSPEAAVGAAALREKYGDEYADKILYRNAEELLINR